ncbi:hypothetical protein HELRODRAFT_143783, partial [Helobdella robusta]|uniref:RING-type domain-containing protein n=1 Tax=Helobdella robusta TaxID=6412 RepID=T1EJC3_HELRO
RAKMTCGHILTPESMADYCRSILQANKHIIQCPAYTCQSEWPYFVVRHISSFALRASELEEFDIMLSERYLNRNIGIQKCPKCSTYIMKDATVKTNNVFCQICSKNGKKKFFCWLCLQPWLSDQESSKCGNLNCSDVDKRITILQDCPNKVILNRDAPSIRGCPKCGLLLEYKSACSQICCKGCKHYFCFFCLKGATSKALLTCDPYNSSCQIAPKQTFLP